MISEIQIKNFKSVQDMTFRPGRVTVLIGENGSGKSNILEAITFAACAATNKLDDEVLFHRGVRVTDNDWMMAAFPMSNDGRESKDIEFQVHGEGEGEHESLQLKVGLGLSTRTPYKRWQILDAEQQKKLENFAREIQKTSHPKSAPLETTVAVEYLMRQLKDLMGNRSVAAEKVGLADFLIFAPENSTLRAQPPEGAVQPLGTKGEGLFRLLGTFSDIELGQLENHLRLFQWFDHIKPVEDQSGSPAKIRIQDRWLASEKSIFDQRSANEGFLFVLFYFVLLMSDRTPKFFAVDNIDTALNPKLCSTLISNVIELSKKYNKQVICTTHNPAALDGLDLQDDAQRLYTVRRGSEGQTLIRRVSAPKPQPGELPVRLSEAFVRGLLGGVPDHF